MEGSMKTANASMASSIFNLVLSIIGAGTLTVPYAVAQTGYLCSMLLFLSVAAINIITLNLSMSCSNALGPSSSYNALCMATVPRFKKVADITAVLATFGILCVYLVVIGDLLPDAVRTVLGPQTHHLLLHRRVWISVYLMAFIVPLVRLKRMDNLRFTSFLGILCFLYIAVVVVVYAVNGDLLNDNERAPPSTRIWPRNGLKILKVLPFFVQIYSCHWNSFSICNELRNRSMARFNVVAASAVFISLTIYVVVGYGAYSTFGDSIGSNIILKYPQTPSLCVLRVSLSIAIAFGYPVNMQSTRNCLSDLVFKEHDIHKLSDSKFHALTYFIVLCSFGISMVTDSITAIIGVIGSTATILVTMVFPGLFYYHFKFEPAESSTFKTFWSILVVIISIILIPFCIIGSTAAVGRGEPMLLSGCTSPFLEDTFIKFNTTKSKAPNANITSYTSNTKCIETILDKIYTFASSFYV